MKVTYIAHSSFFIETSDVIFLFDYVNGQLPYFNKKKKIYVFASHKHHDHFSTDVFALASKYPTIKFILSSDIILKEEIVSKYLNPVELKEKVIFVGKDESIILEDVFIKTLGSTDAGVAFVVTYQNKSYYHAGDLNWWHWFGETTEYNDSMEKDFKNEIEKIKNANFELAFLPLDPRQEEAYWWGFDYFMRNTNTKTVFPMHLWDKYGLIQKLLKENISLPYGKRVKVLLHNHQTFEF